MTRFQNVYQNWHQFTSPGLIVQRLTAPIRESYDHRVGDKVAIGAARWQNAPINRENSFMPKQKRPASSAIMTDKVTELILHDIQTGLLAPGAWLKQIDLEQRYRCGRPEVRRALDRLAQKRLVAHVPNRGYHVYRPDGRQEG
ncbi:hypothetical protein SODG_001412 [Sodalis praecaptivus]|nr:hypothetical protein NVIRENTERO_03864 [Sodalis praecaptivus]